MNIKKTTKQFIEKAINVHGSLYDYRFVNYVNNSTKVKIHCNTCGRDFWQTPGNHLQGKGCLDCAIKRTHNQQKKTLKQFIKDATQIHGKLYDYSKVLYLNAHVKVEIICNTCKNSFFQTPHKHLSNRGCPFCKGSFTKTTEQFIEEAIKIHGNIYDYFKVIYMNTITPVEIICKKCKKSFFQTPHRHLSNRGCPFCKQSKGELRIKKILDNTNTKYIFQKRFIDCKDKLPLPFDFYLPDYNICIEYQGEQHYKEGINFYKCRCKTKEKTLEKFHKQQLHDKIKRDYCKANNIQLIEIKYNENIEEKLDFLKS